MDAVLLLIQAGLIFGVAFIYANLGLGGGLLFVPILLSTGVPDKDLAVPISLTLTIATATSSVINHHRRGLVDFRLGRVLLTGALIGAVVGTVFTLRVLNQETFEAFFAAVLIVFGLYMVRDRVKNARSVDEDDDSALTPPRIGGTAAATAGSGFLSGSMGIGGGLLNVPLLVYVLGRKTRKAIGTSSLLIIPTAAVGFAAYVVDLALRPGGFAWPAEFVLIPILMPVVFVGAYLGSRWGLEKLRTRSVALLFIIVLFIAAAPEPKGWDGPDGRVSLVLLVPPARRGRRRDVDLDSPVRVRARRIAPYRRDHRGRDEPRLGPRVHPLGVALRSHRAPQDLPPDRFPRERGRPLGDGPVRDHVPVLPREPPCGFLGRGERPRRDGPPHGDLEAGGMARAARPRESDRSDRVGRGVGHGGRMARHRAGTAQRGAVVNARALRNRRRARLAVRASRSNLDS